MIADNWTEAYTPIIPFPSSIGTQISIRCSSAIACNSSIQIDIPGKLCLINTYSLSGCNILTECDHGDDEMTVHCHDCDMIASSLEEARANGFCHVKVFDARRLVVGRHDEDQQEAVGRLEDDGYYWLCPDCFHHMRENLLVVESGNLSDNFLTDVDKT